jgi:23S rRNA pseudouridine1911/1915/1917 synthase
MAETWIEVPFEVQRPQEGLRLDAFLAGRLHRYSRSEVQKIIASGRVLRRALPAKASSRLKAGEIVLIRYPKRPEPPCLVESLAILYEDERLIAIDKPAGVLSHPTDKIVDNAVTSIIRRQRPELSAKLVHRLDRETSGVLLLAKDVKTARVLCRMFFERRVEKEYLAVVRGRVEWDRKTLCASIGRENGEIKVRQAVGAGPMAQTEFERLEVAAESSLIRARPRTGRLHQIRVHLAYLGHPVLGDKLYTSGGESYLKAVYRTLSAEDLKELGASRQLLHAERLRLNHPWTDQAMTLIAPLPDDFKSWNISTAS